MRIDSHYSSISGPILKDLLKAYLIELLVYLCYHENHFQEPEVLDPKLSEIVRYIEAHLVEIKNVSDISNGLHMSESSVRKIFCDYAHIPLMTYTRGKKCALANDLMGMGVAPSQVYLQCGFADYSTFYRAYKRAYNCIPSKHYSTD